MVNCFGGEREITSFQRGFVHCILTSEGEEEEEEEESASGVT